MCWVIMRSRRSSFPVADVPGLDDHLDNYGSPGIEEDAPVHVMELDRVQRADILADNTFAIVSSADLTAEEKLASLVSLVPMALEVVEEARVTIVRLREENETLRKELEGR